MYHGGNDPIEILFVIILALFGLILLTIIAAAREQMKQRDRDVK
ncbi:MAG TPA: hypothetical protein VFA78_08835 [Chloroflexota bacterium]|nr:hypothetical protein [Chloroflexota bacterium]